ncbi:MAG: serine hydrolase domain-containing protein [Phenylobacterium sp.]|uniref:serine hydrolase domain-containing protein n=1 Tax=Phenylobacterium sp. TaxID=1871053 RepID=UPI0027346AE6|nr:serine hydrolase domain-containing protein [Phenylobacterium sp.]MDP3174957.1 serine hydrolase domain-containing protein [Phenylobacterium sp.]
MSRLAKTAVAVLAALFVCPPLLSAQEATAPAAAPPAVPSAPIPYTQLRPKPAPVRRAAPARPAATKVQAPAPVVPTVVGALLPTTAQGARLTVGEALPPGELEPFVDGLVRDAMAADHIAGVTVAVVQNGQVVMKKGYGFASLSPARRVDPDRTLFRLGSISKTFTWIALMKEVEAGRMRLEAPINLYLPERLQVRDQGFTQPVRVRHLMDHSAGFETRQLGHLMERRYERERPLQQYLRQERPRRARAPREASTYSNYGVALAGAAVSYVADKPFERLVEDEIFVPLGLSRTTFREARPVRQGLPGPMSAAQAAGLSDGYRWVGGHFEARPFEYMGHIAPAGSASSTAGDMSRYMLMLLNNGTLENATVFGPVAARAFRTPLRRTAPGINGWAHGFVVYDLPGGVRGYGHDGETLSFRTRMVLAPALGLGVFIAANTETGARLTQQAPEALIRHFYAGEQSFPRAGDPALVQSANLYDGYYLPAGRARGGLEAFVDMLRGGVSSEVTPAGRLLLGGREWTPDGDARQGRFIDAMGNQRLAFNVESGGRTFQDSSGGDLFERAGFWRRPPTLALLAGLTALAALATLGGVVTRDRREFRQTSIQSRIALLQNTQAALWLAAIALFVAWAAKTGDAAEVMYGWPHPFLVVASACELVAAALTLATVVALPAVWRGGRRVDSWTPLRKAGFTLTVVIYAAFSAVLWTWGALSPWSG